MKDEIIFTVLADSDEELEPLVDLISEFQIQTGIRVEISRVNWDDAWGKLFNIAVNGGSHVAQIGSTYDGSLRGMSALRTFSPQELRDMGAPDAFFNPAWQSTKSQRGQTFSVPWSSFTYILCYRRDLLKQAGINEETAFSTSEAMSKTLSSLQQTGVEFPWLYPSSLSGQDLMHMAASWVWEAGGDFISSNGKKTLFNTSESRAGLAAFLDLFRFLPGDSSALEFEDCLDMFAQGRAAVIPVTSHYPANLEEWLDSSTLEQVGLAPLPGIPWVGGDNLVIWNHVYKRSLQQAALSLVKFLTSQKAQVSYANHRIILPARKDALPLVSYPPLYKSALNQIMENGRAHYAVRLWTRLENSLGIIMKKLITEYQSDVEQDKNTLLEKHLQPLARNLDNILS